MEWGANQFLGLPSKLHEDDGPTIKLDLLRYFPEAKL